MDEYDGLTPRPPEASPPGPTAEPPWVAEYETAPAPPRRRRRWVLWVSVGAVAAVIALGAAAQTIDVGGPVPAFGFDPTTAPRNDDGPPEGVGETPRPASLPDSPEPNGVSRYWRYLATQSDQHTPVTWDPCRPIHYVVRTTGAPSSAVPIFRDAVAEMSRLTGLRFVDDGTTTEVPSEDRDDWQPARYGDRWAPVLVAFVTSAQDPSMSDEDVVGDTQTLSEQAEDGSDVYVSGEVMFAQDFVTTSLAVGRSADVRATMLHELGHLVGLDHVDNAAMLMNPDAVDGVVDFASQERQGLRSLGAGRCHPDI